MSRRKCNRGINIVSRVIALIGALLLFCNMAACGSGSSSVVSKWYNEKGKCLDVRKDGSWKLEDSYGTGTWKKLDNGVFEFTDFYGDTQESAINEDELGQYIDFGYYGDFYKNVYPIKEDQNESQNQIAETDVTEETVIELDPFENLTYEVSGISPYCKVAVNNSQTSDEVQKYVTYTLDKEVYANNEKMVITAHLSSNIENESYKLSHTEKEYTISGQAEYLTDLDDETILFIKDELEDYITARQASDTGSQFIFDYNAVYLSYINSVVPENVSYFAVLKKIKYDQFNSMDYFNSYTNIYSVSYTTRNDDTHTVYIAVAANNIIKTADGTIKWGNKALDYDFECEGNDESIEKCITITVMDDSQNYNISKVENAIN